jgi:hypothetical protein
VQVTLLNDVASTYNVTEETYALMKRNIHLGGEFVYDILPDGLARINWGIVKDLKLVENSGYEVIVDATESVYPSDPKDIKW